MSPRTSRWDEDEVRSPRGVFRIARTGSGGRRHQWKMEDPDHLPPFRWGTKRFGELRRSLPGVHHGTLTYELRGLEADGIIQRTQYLTIPPTVEYTLTARGNALKPVFIALSRWNQATKEMRPASPTESK